MKTPQGQNGKQEHPVVRQAGGLKPLPAGVREELDRRLLERGFMNYETLARWLQEQGCEITTPTVRRNANKLERRLEAVRMATAQARAVVEASPEDDLMMTEALMRLVQQHLFSMLVELNPHEPKRANLTVLARGVAEMGRAMISQKKFAEEMRTRLAARIKVAEGKVMGAARIAAAQDGVKGGLTAQAEADIRRALLEITQ